MKLFFREYLPSDVANAKQTIVILHGLFGSSDNWLTQARLLSNNNYKIYTVDLANHGQSYHNNTFDYPTMVSDLKELLDELKLQEPVILGHSMGGKTAMNFALAHPDALSKLIVVDIAPRYYDLEHYTIVKGLNAIPVDTITSRNEADAVLAEFVPEVDVRQFLLKNLQRKTEGGFSWKINLPLITQQLGNIGVDLQFNGKFDKPTLFIRGRRSKYILDSDLNRIKEVFPQATLETMETGHWVQAENPQEFVDLVMKWVQ
ncbi:alpha/beta fold hydrolase [Ohtaekwangia koreensis]|uniref:Pimeloyl-ACP methyl ester carboxylesterase n=1 Tax=Ohtaekwangia koreensis TaxID=688867 RepID=A0A1T5LEK6_9BACT|nr:alpha/beta fold hydrolase [Ohtaekwangia koreensis]SKC74421.1 Pimeloyl-ACP methyl ester carboxylesterase [Ohtaekwangia koreensis]